MSDASASGAQLPALTGSHPVGVRRVHLARGEHELMANVYYPAANAAEPWPYVWDPDVLVPGLDRFYAAIPARFDAARLRAMRSHASIDVPPAAGRYPLVVFSHGKGAALVQNVSRVEDLASHGFLVVGVEHPGGTFATRFPDGRVVAFEELSDGERIRWWCAEISFVLDAIDGSAPELAPLRSVIDRERVGLMGRAFGGAAVAHAESRDPRVRAVVNLGGPSLEAQVRCAYLQVERAELADRGRAICAAMRGPARLVAIGGIGTTSMSDTPYLPWIVPPPATFFGVVDRYAAARVIGRTVGAFFAHELRDESADPAAAEDGGVAVSLETWRV